MGGHGEPLVVVKLFLELGQQQSLGFNRQPPLVLHVLNLHNRTSSTFKVLTQSKEAAPVSGLSARLMESMKASMPSGSIVAPASSHRVLLKSLGDVVAFPERLTLVFLEVLDSLGFSVFSSFVSVARSSPYRCCVSFLALPNLAPI